MSKYWQFRGELSLCDNLLLYGTRIVVPDKMKHETLQKIHQGHQGIQRCRLRVNTSVWWPGVSRDMEEFVRSCPECQQSAILPREPLLQSPLPSHPWERVASDLFEHKKSTYLLVVDYFSRFVEIEKLTSTTSSSVITHLKAIFSRHGIPATLITDNGPQYSSEEINKFSLTYGFQHVTSSPHYHQSNGQAERAVRTVKSLLSNSSDPYLALLNYRASPLPWCGLSPAELLMGRVIRTDVPQHTRAFQPDWPYLKEFRERERKYRDDQKWNYDKHYRTRSLPDLPENTPVWVDMQNGQVQGTIVSSAPEPRSYIVTVPSGEVRRNRSHLRTRTSEVVTVSNSTSVTRQIQTRSKTGTEIRPPQRYKN